MGKLSKFDDVDVFASLSAILKQNTGFYQSDFDIDKSIITQAAASPQKEDKTLLWLCRPMGTHCFRERDVFLKDTAPHNTWRFYREQTSDRILAYAIELTGTEHGKVKGNLYELDYAKHYERVKDKELAADTVRLNTVHGIYPPDSILQAIPIRFTENLNALKLSPTTRTRCDFSCRRKSTAGSSLRRGISKHISPFCMTG